MNQTLAATVTAVGSPVLEVRSTGGVRRYPLTAPTYRVGRDPANDIVIGEPVVSRQHFVLERTAGGYRLRDTSTFGTFVDRRKIAELELSNRTELLIGPGTAATVTLVYQPSGTAPGSSAPFPPVDLSNRAALVIGRDPDADLRLSDPVVSRRHAVLEHAADGSWAIRDLGSFNGTYVNGNAVQRAPLSPGTVIQLGNTRAIFSGSQLVWAETSRGMQVEVEEVVKEGDQRRILLDGVSFVAAPGELVAVLGVSGAGKSTLLGALTGLRPATRGEIRFNGSSFYRHREVFRNGIGYVPQDDIIHRELTVERALWYAARLRMPTDTPPAELRQRVATVLDEVGLTDRAGAPIGRLSGGQRKRVSIAVEILTRPPLLLLDEPTSGLDPGLDKQLMTLLDRFAGEGQTVLVVTHAVGNIDLCDAVVFLANGGRLAFFGSPREARAYFGTPDFAEIYRAVDNEKEPAEWRDHFRASPLYAANVAARLQPSPSGGFGGAPAAANAGRRSLGLHHFAVLARRYLEIIARDRGNLGFLLAQTPVVALMLLFVADPRAFDAGPVRPTDAHKILYIMTCSALWLGVINSVREIVKENAIYEREHNVGIGLGPYLASKVAVLSLFAAVQVLLLVVIVAIRVALPGGGIVLPVALEMYVTLFLTALAGIAFGLALSALTTSPDRAMSLSPFLLIPPIIFGGMVFKLEGATRLLGWVTIAYGSLQGLVATTGLRFDAQAQPLDDSARTAAYLLTRWSVLLLLSAGGLVATALLLRARDHEGPLLSRLAQAARPGKAGR